MSMKQILKNIIDHQKETFTKIKNFFYLIKISIYQVISILQVDRSFTIGGQKTVPSGLIIANACIYPCV